MKEVALQFGPDIKALLGNMENGLRPLLGDKIDLWMLEFLPETGGAAIANTKNEIRDQLAFYQSIDGLIKEEIQR